MGVPGEWEDPHVRHTPASPSHPEEQQYHMVLGDLEGSQAWGHHVQPLSGVWSGAGLWNRTECSEPLALFSSCLPPCSSQPEGSSPAQPAPLPQTGEPFF